MRLACRAASPAPSPAHLFPASTLSLNAPSHAPAFAQIHDELLLEVRADALSNVAATVAAALEGVAATFGLGVALPVRLAAGPSWGVLREVGW